MAETLSYIRPSLVGYNNICTSKDKPLSLLFDNNDEDYCSTVVNSGTGAFLGGFDFSSIPDNATITNISLTITGRSRDSTAQIMYGQLVKDPSSSGINTFTDLGDGRQQFWKGKVLTTTTIDFPIAASVCSVAFLKSGGLYVRLYQSSGYQYVYALYLNVTYEVPITVTVKASPAEGGTVTGGGTYEKGATVTATATPKTGYAFSHWLVNGEIAGSSNPISGVLTSDTTVTAIFIKVETSKVYCGTKKVSVYCGKQKVSVYCGTVKIL